MSAPTDLTVLGYSVQLHEDIGHLIVYHGGYIMWDTLQEIKTFLWGPHSRAIEVYPATSNVVNNVNARHLWLLGENDFCPDLLGDVPLSGSLETRYRQGWHEAHMSVMQIPT